MARARKPRRSRRSGLLLGIGTVFALSIVLRIGTMGFDIVAPAQASDPLPGTSVAGPTSPIRAALDEVTALRDRLAMREAEVADRERAIAAAQALLEARLAELAAAETRLEALIRTSDEAAEADLARLTQVYETMDPGQAAALFEQMDPSFAGGFLTRMPPAISAGIMAELDPVTAYAISVLIATRNAGAPRLPDAAQDPAPETDS